jgi:hypothetical protein
MVGRRDGVGLRLLLGAASLCITVAVSESALAFVGFEVRSGMGRSCVGYPPRREVVAGGGFVWSR